MGIDFYDRMWEEEQKEKERFGQRKNEIENELSSQSRKIERLEKENEELKIRLGVSEHDREHNDYELAEAYKTIDKLKEQIEKMKQCGNCTYYQCNYCIKREKRVEYHNCCVEWEIGK